MSASGVVGDFFRFENGRQVDRKVREVIWRGCEGGEEGAWVYRYSNYLKGGR